MKIIVFGGTGWLGHTIVNQLAASRHQVVACSRGKNNGFALPDRLRHIIADKSDPAAVEAIFSADRYDVVIDTCPSTKSVENIFRSAAGIKHYIHCSSTGGYAPLPFIPADETAPYLGAQFPGSGWVEKYEVDTLIRDKFSRCGFPGTIIRPCYITGVGMLPLDNLGDRRESFLADVKNEAVLDLPDNGLALLQPVEIGDLASAFVLAAERPQSIGEIYNVTSDHAFTLLRYLELTAAVFGVKPHVNLMSVDAILAKYGSSINAQWLRFLACHMCFTNAKARRELDFAPKYGPEEAVEMTARWGAEFLHL